MTAPTVSVVLPAYQAEKHLAEAVQSILDQTFTDFELLIINDGSTDRTAEIIQSFEDKRIVHIRHAENQKLIASLNEGIAQARGKYIARMDADDISHHTRLQKQVEFL
ncbi:MAG TPA: glycosyltransferase family 2 protein, partial [Bacteroidia bacterium]|nr:glycosyltransferase family 2 protein [Bacteroidia bacterium]